MPAPCRRGWMAWRFQRSGEGAARRWLTIVNGVHMDMPRARNVVLIDYENVQPPSLKELVAPGFTVLIFVGASQSRISMDVAEAVQALGGNGRYVRCNGSGSNALDFHIAFYIGEMAAADPSAFFQIVSRDTGFDPLVAHLQSRRLNVLRCASVADLPMLRGTQQAPAKPPTPVVSKAKPPALSVDARLQRVHAVLVKQGKARPASMKSLTCAINSLFQKALPAKDVTALIQQLQQKKWITLEGSKVRYQLPSKVA